MTPTRVAVLIPAKDESARIAATVRAAASLPHVDLVVVVDDGSRDATDEIAHAAGAVVLRHPRNRGKGAALSTGGDFVRALEMRDLAVGRDVTATARALLLLDADLEATARHAAPLIVAVIDGSADMSIGVLPGQRLADGSAPGGRGLVVGLARSGIASATGLAMRQPLSGQRCLTRAAFDAGTPLAGGFGVEVGLTIDVSRAGLRTLEVDVDLRHRATGSDWRAQRHRARQWRDVAAALATRGALAGAVRRR